jgi:hypothetical protein
MSFRLDIDKTNNKFFIHQKNYVDIDNDTIKIRNAFSEDGVYEFPYTGNIVEFTVPTSGTYKIEAWGATGGGGHTPMGPKGAYSKSFVFLIKDERIKILVGEKGYPGNNIGTDHIYCGGGGGGTFIAKDRTPLCVAGGGGSLTYNTYLTIQSHACGQSTQLSANFGTGQASLKMGGTATTDSYGAAGGGGFEGNGADGTSYGRGGISFINGGARQTSGTYNNSAYGGFGGGASQHGYCGHGAGGGGYTGGSAAPSTSTSIQGGGGGSYYEGFYNNEVSEAISGCNESLPTNPGTNGNGFALLTLLTGKPSQDTVNKKVTCLHYNSHMSWILFVTLLSQ